MTVRPRYSEREAFSLYLRYGIRVPVGPDEESEGERKFNPYHDPDDGRFTFAPGGGTRPPRRRSGESAGMAERVQRQPPVAPKPKPVAKPQAAPKPKPTDHSGLSKRYEASGRGDPGLISTGRGDAGGMSYGPHQIAARTGTLKEFIASSEMKQWAKRFHGLRPETDAFNAQWRLLARQEPAAFLRAQDNFVNRTHYEDAVAKVALATRYNLDEHSEALRQVTYSTAVQHGPTGGPSVIVSAIARTDGQLPRNDPRYERSLINNIYYQRTFDFIKKRDSEITKGLKERARVSNNVVKDRFPDEHEHALLMLFGLWNP